MSILDCDLNHFERHSMESVSCKKCGNKIPEDAFECHFCGGETGIYDDYHNEMDALADAHSKWYEEDLKKHGGIPPRARDIEFGIGGDAIVIKGQDDYINSLVDLAWHDQSLGSSFGNFLPYAERSLDLKPSTKEQSYLSFSGDPKLDIHEKIRNDFFTEILSVKKQNGQKYKPNTPGGKIWSKPMLEVTTRHGIYITYAEATWVLNCFGRRQVNVWSEKTTREGFLWLHQGINFDPTINNELICAGCCNKTPDDIPLF